MLGPRKRIGPTGNFQQNLGLSVMKASRKLPNARFQIRGVSDEGGTAMRGFINRSVLFLIGIICVGSVAFTTLAQAETLVESQLYFRTYVAFSVDQKAVQAWLPDPWKAVSLPKGPFKGANLYVMFEDMFLKQDGEGKPAKGETYHAALLVAFAKHPQTGDFAVFVIRIYSPHGGPGPYKNTVKATVRREATLKGADLEPGAGSEVSVRFDEESCKGLEPYGSIVGKVEAAEHAEPDVARRWALPERLPPPAPKAQHLAPELPPRRIILARLVRLRLVERDHDLGETIHHCIQVVNHRFRRPSLLRQCDRPAEHDPAPMRCQIGLGGPQHRD